MRFYDIEGIEENPQDMKFYIDEKELVETYCLVDEMIDYYFYE